MKQKKKRKIIPMKKIINDTETFRIAIRNANNKQKMKCSKLHSKCKTTSCYNCIIKDKPNTFIFGGKNESKTQSN